jgi:hypothetical protein
MILVICGLARPVLLLIAILVAGGIANAALFLYTQESPDMDPYKSSNRSLKSKSYILCNLLHRGEPESYQ